MKLNVHKIQLIKAKGKRRHFCINANAKCCGHAVLAFPIFTKDHLFFLVRKIRMSQTVHEFHACIMISIIRFLTVESTQWEWNVTYIMFALCGYSFSSCLKQLFAIINVLKKEPLEEKSADFSAEINIRVDCICINNI